MVERICKGLYGEHVRLVELGESIGAQTGDHNVFFHQVLDVMSKTHSVNKEWEFVSKGTEVSLGKFVSDQV